TVASIFTAPLTARGHPLEAHVNWPRGRVAGGCDAHFSSTVAGGLHVAYPVGRKAHPRFSIALVPTCATPGLYLSRYQGHVGYQLPGAARCTVRPVDGPADYAAPAELGHHASGHGLCDGTSQLAIGPGGAVDFSGAADHPQDF